MVQRCITVLQSMKVLFSSHMFNIRGRKSIFHSNVHPGGMRVGHEQPACAQLIRGIVFQLLVDVNDVKLLRICGAYLDISLKYIISQPYVGGIAHRDFFKRRDTFANDIQT